MYYWSLETLLLLARVWGEVQICIWPSWWHCHSLSLCSSKFRLVSPSWFYLAGAGSPG